jgi:hypothetical protein
MADDEATDIELENNEKARIMVEYGELLFPKDTWTDREIDMLEDMGIAWVFGLKDYDYDF